MVHLNGISRTEALGHASFVINHAQCNLQSVAVCMSNRTIIAVIYPVFLNMVVMEKVSKTVLDVCVCVCRSNPLSLLMILIVIRICLPTYLYNSFSQTPVHDLQSSSVACPHNIWTKLPVKVIDISCRVSWNDWNLFPKLTSSKLLYTILNTSVFIIHN